MSKVLKQFCGEAEVRIVSNSFCPTFHHFRLRNAIKSVIQLDQIEINSEIGELIKPARFGFRVDDPLPISVRPTCYAEVDVINRTRALNRDRDPPLNSYSQFHIPQLLHPSGRRMY